MAEPVVNHVVIGLITESVNGNCTGSFKRIPFSDFIWVNKIVEPEAITRIGIATCNFELGA